MWWTIKDYFLHEKNSFRKTVLVVFCFCFLLRIHIICANCCCDEIGFKLTPKRYDWRKVYMLFFNTSLNSVLTIFKMINRMIFFSFSVNVSQSTLVRPVARLVTLVGNCTALSMESSLMAICHPIKLWEVGVTPEININSDWPPK